MPKPEIKSEEISMFPLCVATTCLLGLVLLPAVVPFLPVLYWDTLPIPDPNNPPHPITFLGPTAAAYVNILIVLMSGVCTFLAKRAGAHSPSILSGLLLLSLVSPLYWIDQSYGNALQSAPVIAAIASAIAAVHVVQFSEARKIIFAGLAALLIPFLLFSLFYLYVSQPLTVENFQAQKEAFLAAKGWQENSAQHLLYIRRLASPDAIGTFGLSNVLGSFTAAISLLCLVAFLAWVRHVTKNKAMVVTLAMLSIAGLLVTILTHSKGALAVLLLVALMLPIAYLVYMKKTPRGVLPVVVVLMLFLPVVAVLVRGMVGLPESHLGERSLLFRYQYWQATVRMMGYAHFFDWLFGIGPSDFGTLYLLYKSPYSPEEVSAPHQMFLSYISNFGLFGLIFFLSLCVVPLVSFMRLFRKKSVNRKTELRLISLTKRQIAVLTAIITATLFLTRYIVKYPEMYAETVVLLFTASCVYASVFFVLSRTLSKSSGLISLGLLVAGVALLVHNQIEMTFYQSTSTVMATFMVACGYVGKESPKMTRGSSKARQYLVAGLLLVMLPFLFGVYVQPVSTYQSFMREAYLAMHANNPQKAIENLGRAIALQPTSQTASEQRIALQIQFATAFDKAGYPKQAEVMLGQARKSAKKFVQSQPTLPSSHRHLAMVEMFSADMYGNRTSLDAAIEAERQVLTLSPLSLRDHMLLAELYWQAGQWKKAAAMYQRTIKISKDLYLDPVRQLTEKQVGIATSRIKQATVKTDVNSQ